MTAKGKAKTTRARKPKPDPGATAGEKPREKPKGDDVLTVHVLKDGFTAMGRVWYRGQEISVKPGTPDFEKTVVGGKSVLTMSREEQWDKYGEELFAPGPWPGRPAVVDEDEYLASLPPGERAAVEIYEGSRKAKTRALG